MRCAAACAPLLALALAAPIAPADASVTPADVAATEAYLSALYGYDQAIATSAPRSEAATENLVDRISAECPGALSGAPPTDPNTARGLGEEVRQSRQLRELEAEVESATSAARASAYSEAASAFADALAPLQWSNATLTALVHSQVLALEERLQAPALEVCADARAWVSSGYRTLSTGTKAFLTAQEAERAERKRRRAEAGDESISKLLAPYESAGARALVKRIDALSNRLATEAFEAAQRAWQRVDAALGIHPESHEPESSKPRTVIGRGRTAAGDRFVVTVESGRAERECKLRVSVGRPEESKTPTLGGGLALGFGACLSSRYSGAAPSVNCNGGVLTITAYTRPAARSVRLLLSNGRTVTSKVIRAPRRGGHVGLYYQEVRGPSPIPVSLTVLDASGRTIDVVKLPAIVECTKHPVKYLPGGRPRTLVSVQAPEGPRFAIVGERYRFLGHVHFELEAKRSSTEREEVEGGFSVGEGSIITLRARPRPPAFRLEESTGCRPHAYDVVWGLLKPPGETVLVRVAGVLTQLHERAIPAQLHAGGRLVYGAFSSPPTEVIVRDARGKTLSRESLAELAKQTTEECEGEAELGGGPEPAGVGEGASEIVVGDLRQRQPVRGRGPAGL